MRGGRLSAPDDPGSDEDIGLDGRAIIADRLDCEVGWLRRCAGCIAAVDEFARTHRINELDTAAIRSERP
ncbi:MAG: hypothetical protein ACRDTA_14815 [Pseudonocardiaceae bacterium]